MTKKDLEMNLFHQEIKTNRLKLNKFSLEDASIVCKILSDGEIANTTKNMPYPYDESMATEWIAQHKARLNQGEALIWAIRLAQSEQLIGCIELKITTQHHHAALGFWVAKDYWGQGYCTEAATYVTRFAFDKIGLNKIFACHMTRNPGSGRVMQKIGMQHEGSFKRHFLKGKQFEDFEFYGLLTEQNK